MDDLHHILTNGVIAAPVPGFVVTDARIMKIDTCVLGLVPALVCKARMAVYTQREMLVLLNTGRNRNWCLHLLL